MKVLLVILFACISNFAHAEVFKCSNEFGKTIYQAKPCQSQLKEKQLNIKSDATNGADKSSDAVPVFSIDTLKDEQNMEMQQAEPTPPPQ